MDTSSDIFSAIRILTRYIGFAFFIFNNPYEYYELDYLQHPMLLVKGKFRKSKNKKSSITIARIKNNKGEFVDIQKIKKDNTSF